MAIKSDPSTWRDPRHRDGVAGEQAAMRFLERQGWEVLEHRYRLGRLEVDLIARRGDLVAFVEVKTRRSARFGSPQEAVGWRKRREISRVAQAWVDRHGRRGERYRFDVIAVRAGRGGGPPDIEHLADAFRLGWR